MSVAEPSTILPLIVHHFSESVILVGVFASLLRGGAIAVQLFAAFYAQGYKRVMPYMRKVFLARFISWFMIGLAILLIGDKNPALTLWVFGIGLFIFSFSAGFGSIYFSEIIAKIFNKTERGKSMANRQFYAAIAHNKLDIEEIVSPDHEDLRDSPETFNDCDIAIAIGNPYKHKIRNFNGYKIYPAIDAVDGLQDRFRFVEIRKNRYGSGANRIIPCLFIGETSEYKNIKKPLELTKEYYLKISNLMRTYG